MSNLPEYRDVAIIGAGIVGTAIARDLSCYDASCVVLEKNLDVGAETSKANSAILHTGFDAPPESLESRLLQKSYQRFRQETPGLGVAIESVGALLVAWTDEEASHLQTIQQKAKENGVTDTRIISTEVLYRREPHLAPGAKAALEVPGESIVDPFTPVIAFAREAARNGVEFRFRSPLQRVEATREGLCQLSTPSGAIAARYVINAAGLYSDTIDRLFGHEEFKVTPRKGEFILYDKIARSLLNSIILPVPTEKTKGMLVCPTVFGNILAGPTADDQDDKSDTSTSAGGLRRVRENAERLVPELASQPVTAAYAGLRAATEHRDYQIHFHPDQRYITVGGIRSTGLSGCLGISAYVIESLREMGFDADRVKDLPNIPSHNLGEMFPRPYCIADQLNLDREYGSIVCHCERVSRREIAEALTGLLPARDIGGLRRRTRAGAGRCQGSHCHAEIIAEISRATNRSMEAVLGANEEHD